MPIDQSQKEQIIARLRGVERLLNNSINHTAHTDRSYPTAAKRYNEIAHWLNEESKNSPILGSANLNFNPFEEIDCDDFGNYKLAIRLQNTIRLLIHDLESVLKIEETVAGGTSPFKEKKQTADRGVGFFKNITETQKNTIWTCIAVAAMFIVPSGWAWKISWALLFLIYPIHFFIPNQIKGNSKWLVASCPFVSSLIIASSIYFVRYQNNESSKTQPLLPQTKVTNLVTPKIEKPEIKNGNFESFFKRWDRFEKGQLITTTSFVSSDVAQYATAPTVGVSMPPPPGVFNIFQGVGNNRTNGLYIVCESKPEPEKYSRIQQEIEGLKPGALYKIKFWMERFENSTIHPDSLYMALGEPWNNDNKVFYDKDLKNGWNEIIIKNPSRETEIFYIVVNDVTNGLILDDISIEEAK